ncbi:MAG: hypothetical protein MUD14_29175 [Hydrococcus sp. Prado102]|nr:hypothetical protein [Hydrococcus sp. Prado102]
MQAAVITLALVIILVAISYQRKKADSDGSSEVNLPRLSALVHLLASYFFYGIGYFSFIFADRMKNKF